MSVFILYHISILAFWKLSNLLPFPSLLRSWLTGHLGSFVGCEKLLLMQIKGQGILLPGPEIHTFKESEFYRVLGSEEEIHRQYRVWCFWTGVTGWQEARLPAACLVLSLIERIWDFKSQTWIPALLFISC